MQRPRKLNRREALKLAGGAGKNRLAAQIRSHLALFEASKPYRMPEVPNMPGPGKKD